MPHPSRHRRSVPALAPATALAAALVCGACGPASAPVERTIDEYVREVQLENPAELFCLSAGARSAAPQAGAETDPRESFRVWLRSEYDRYLEGRRQGEVDLESSPVVLAKAFALGKGTFYSLDPIRFEGEDVARVDMTVRFAYGEVDVAGLSPGTTFYLCGSPPGRIHAVRVPRVPGTESRVVLETIRVRWTLLREPAAEGCPGGWAVHAAEPDPGTETTRRITWVF